MEGPPRLEGPRRLSVVLQIKSKLPNMAHTALYYPVTSDGLATSLLILFFLASPETP